MSISSKKVCVTPVFWATALGFLELLEVHNVIEAGTMYVHVFCT